MNRILVLTTLAMFAGLAFSGCLSADDAPTASGEEDAGAADAVATSDTGSIKGKVVSTDIQELQGVAVFASKGDELAADTTTDASGKFTLNGLEPGRYVVQFTKAGFKDDARPVDVEANTVTELNVQIARLTAQDLGEAYVVHNETVGFTGCAFGVMVVEGTLAPRATLCGTYDENDKFLWEFPVQSGLKEIVFGMTWDPVGGVSGKEMNINIENHDCSGVSCTYEYADVSGPPDLVFSISDDDITDEAWKFSEINGTRMLQIRVFAAATIPPNVVYQQPFKIYWDAFYNEPAPDGHNPIPDQ